MIVWRVVVERVPIKVFKEGLIYSDLSAAQGCVAISMAVSH
jgi:hypothetical protein